MQQHEKKNELLRNLKNGYFIYNNLIYSNCKYYLILDECKSSCTIPTDIIRRVV